MARTGKDLFEMLQLRQRGSLAAPRPRARAPEPRGPAGDLAGRVRGWLAGLTAGAPRARSKRRPAPKSAAGGGLAVPGLWAAALAVGALGLGFALGRGTAAAGGGEELRRAASPGPAAPGMLPEAPAGTAPALDTAKEEEILSDRFFFLLQFPARERARASNVASHLREHGVETARIRKATTRGEPCWAVFVYVPSADEGPACLERLKAVPAPSFEPEYARGLEQCIKIGLISE